MVEDDGVGIPEAKLTTLLDRGIGVTNVNETVESAVWKRIPNVDRKPTRKRYAHPDRNA